MWDILTGLGTFQDRFAATPAGFPDHDAAMFFMGQKSFGERLHRTLMAADPARLILMHHEHDEAFQKPKPPRKTRSQHG